MAERGREDTEDTTGVTGPQTARNPQAGEIEENVEEHGGGPAGVTVPEGWEPDDEGKPKQE
jgi:hypothetical protein